MYVDYSSWETFEYKATSLELDKKNPRFEHLEQDLNQTLIMKYLIQHEQVYDLAKKISEEGYFVGEEPIICIENNKKVVLEGNRRTAALKLLQDPKKYLPTAKANILLRNILTNNFNVDKKIRCYIAPNRLLANPIIYERHHGDTLHKWKTGNQYAFVSKMYYDDGLCIDDICDVLNETRANVIKPLKAYNLFFEGKDVLEKEEGIILNIANFNFTNLERFYNYEDARKLLGIDFDDDGQLEIYLPREEFEKRLLAIFRMLVDAERFSRDFNNDNDKRRFVENLRKTPEFDFTVLEKKSIFKGKKANERKDLEDEKSKVNPRRRNRSKKNSYFSAIIPGDKEIVFDNEKLDELFAELKSLPLDKRYSFALLIRTYLEQSIYFYLKEKGLLENVSLKIQEKKQKDNEAKIESLVRYLAGKFSISKEAVDKDKIMEILKFKHSEGYVDVTLKGMLEYIKNNELNNYLDATTLRNLKQYIDLVKNDLDLAVHNIKTIIDLESNKRAWKHLEPLFEILSNNIKIEE